MQRLAELISPLGKDLLFYQLTGIEQMSAPSAFSLTMLSEKSDIDFAKLLGQHLSVKMQTPEDTGDGGYRYFDGVVETMQYGGMKGRYHVYLASVKSWFHFLARNQNSKIFQDKSVVQIVKEVFAKHAGLAKFDFKTTASYTPWPYCTQWRESDFNFISRLLELEGIGYYFTHEAGQHTMVLTDGPVGHNPFAGYAKVPWQSPAQAKRGDGEAIEQWTLQQTVMPGQSVVTDYDFQRPSVDLTQTRAEARTHALADAEVFDYPGEYVKEADGQQFVQSQMEAQFAATLRATGSSAARGLACGHLFTLQGFIRQEQNIQYLLCRTELQLLQAGYEGLDGDSGSGSNGGSSFSCGFNALDAKVPFRPTRQSRKSLALGPQTAVVVGPAGDEIHTDEYGRVKVHFHWDRYGKKDGSDTCWVRVSQPWAGKNFGFQAIPRIGQEVIVDFLNADPNEPIITGRVYNAEQMTPWDLPANKTQSGVLTRSTSGGHYGTANAIRFEDKLGSEELWLHAEKDQLTEVENDEKKWVGRDRVKDIDRHETTTVKGNRTETVNLDETITVHQNRTERVDLDEKVSIGKNRSEDVELNENIEIGQNRTEFVGANETITVTKNRTENVGQNENVSIGGSKTQSIAKTYTQTVALAKINNVGLGYSLNVGAAMNTLVGGFNLEQVGIYKRIDVLGGNFNVSVANGSMIIEAAKEIRLKVGDSELVMNAEGVVTLNGKKATFGLGDNIALNSERIDFN